MAESMQGLHRSHRCTEVNNTMIGNTVTVMGWVQKSRNKGGIIFVDLRDRSGILQVIFEEANCGAESFAKAEKLRSEFVVAITGEVAKRGGAVNENLATGDTPTERFGRVTYRIYLGYTAENDPANDYDIERNVHYTYNVTIKGMNDLVVEAKSDKAKEEELSLIHI